MTTRNELVTLLLLIAALCFGMAIGLMLSQANRAPEPEPRDPGDCAGEMPDDGKIIDAKDLQEAG